MGSVENLLWVLRILIEVLSRAHAKVCVWGGGGGGMGGGNLMISGLALLLDAASMAVKGLNLGYYVIIVMQALNIDLPSSLPPPQPPPPPKKNPMKCRGKHLSPALRRRRKMATFYCHYIFS